MFACNCTSIRNYLLIASFAVIAMLPAYYNGVPNGNDQYQHFQFAWTIYDSVSRGDLYPSLAGETNHGFGEVGLRFYPQLTYYALSAGYFVTRDWYCASLLTFTIVFFVGGIGIYLWACEDLEPETALMATGLYTFVPYHLNQLYNNALFAEFFAMAVIPFCFLFLTRICRDGRWLSVLGLAFSYGLLVLTHLPLTIICSIAFGLYGMVLIRKASLWPTGIKLITAVTYSVLMTSFYWVRWLPELAWLKHSSHAYFSNIWNYGSNFLLLPSHFIGDGEDVENLWLADLFLVVMLLSVIPTLVFFVGNKRARTKSTIALLAGLTLSTFMTTPLSRFVWNNLLLLQKVQFPWRWLALVTAFGSVLGSIRH